MPWRCAVFRNDARPAGLHTITMLTSYLEGGSGVGRLCQTSGCKGANVVLQRVPREWTVGRERSLVMPSVVPSCGRIPMFSTGRGSEVDMTAHLRAL